MQDFHEPVYCLVINDKAGKTHEVFGQKSILKVHLDAWAGREWTDLDFLMVEGICNTVDRAQLFVCLKYEEISSMALYLFS